METTASRRAALIAITIISFALPFMLSGVNIGLPAIGREFASSAVLLTWVSTAYSLATAVLLVPAGKLADIYGRKRLFTIGIAIYTVASVFCALAMNAPFLLAARIVQGASAALIFATSVAILTSVYPPGERGRVLGINTAAVYVGLSAGPFLGGMIVETLGWRAVFWLNVPLAAITLAFTLTRVRGEWADSPGDRFDLPGALICGAAVVGLIVGLGQLPALRGVWILLTGLAAGVIFVRHSSRTPSPMLDLGIFRGNRFFSLSAVAALIDYSSTYSVTFLMSLYLQYIKALSAREAGLVMVAQPIIQAIFSPLAGRLSDRIEARYVATAGMSLTLVGILLLTMLSAEAGLVYIIACMLVLGLGFAFFSSPNTSALMGAVQRRHYGVASSLVALMRTLGQMISMGMVMILFSIFMGQAQITPAVYPQFMESTRVAFIISSVLCALGVIASMIRGRMPSDDDGVATQNAIVLSEPAPEALD